MVKTKFRSKNKFLGRRKKPVKRLLSCNTPDDLTSVNKSASARKFDLMDVDLDSFSENEEDNIDTNCFTFAQVSSLNKLIRKFLCPACKQASLNVKIDVANSYGFASKARVICGECMTSIAEEVLSERVVSNNEAIGRSPFEINLRAAVAFRGIGCGHSALTEWGSIMNMPRLLAKTTFQSLQERVCEGSRKACNEVLQKTVEKVKMAYKKIGVVPDEDGNLDISVSFDGTWQRRGHSSHNGVASVIDLLTGLPIDVEVLSNHCSKCKNGPDESDPTYENWKKNHSSVCQKNFDGTSNAMEVECAKRIWSRSVEKYGLCYTTMLSDGDSKAYDTISTMEVYGKDKTVDKEECINHVSKRMGTALRNLVAEAKAKKKPIGGRGKLTKETMTKIQNYYGRAIKDNSGDTSMMKKRIFAILFHLSSTDAAPKHVHCPPGEQSWYFWQRAVAKGEVPGKHKEHEGLPVEIGQKLVPIFQRLIEESLLERCKQNRTQNANESLHNLIWRFCPKITYVGKKVIEMAVHLSICQFSVGATVKSLLLDILCLSPGKSLMDTAKRKSKDRIRSAEKACEEGAKKRRRKLRYEKATKQKKTSSHEGSSYKSGAF